MTENQPTAVGAMRRLRALHARGWTADTIEQATGFPARITSVTLVHASRITPEHVRQAAVVYDRLWNQPPPAGTVQDPVIASRARHWPPPLGWDDDVIDRPDGRPADGWRRTASPQRRVEHVAEDVAFVREHGGYQHATLAQIAMRLGYTRAAVDKALSRARERELEAG